MDNSDIQLSIEGAMDVSRHVHDWIANSVARGADFDAMCHGILACVVTDLATVGGGPQIAALHRFTADRVEHLPSLPDAVLAATPPVGRA